MILQPEARQNILGWCSSYLGDNPTPPDLYNPCYKDISPLTLSRNCTRASIKLCTTHQKQQYMPGEEVWCSCLLRFPPPKSVRAASALGHLKYPLPTASRPNSPCYVWLAHLVFLTPLIRACFHLLIYLWPLILFKVYSLIESHFKIPQRYVPSLILSLFLLRTNENLACKLHVQLEIIFIKT